MMRSNQMKASVVVLMMSLIMACSVYINAHAETIHYKITQMGIKAGEASLSFKGDVVYKGENLELIEFKAKGFNFLDEELIYVTPKEYRPRFVRRNLNIFGNKETIDEEYQQGKIVITKNSGGKEEVQTIVNAQPVDNIYGFIYRFRQQGVFQVGTSLDINLPTKKLSIKVAKQQKLEVAGDVVDTYYLQSNPAKYKIWFGAGSDKLPLRISGAMGIANTMMLMTSVEK